MSVVSAVATGGGGGGGRQNMRVPPQPINSHHATALLLSPSPPLLSLLPTSRGQIRAFHIVAEQLTHQPPREVSKGWNDLKLKISLGTCIITVALESGPRYKHMISRNLYANLKKYKLEWRRAIQVLYLRICINTTG